ncbi:MAG TPA: hypothetical protein VF614_01400 [Chthoniobacteraceae bacterium]|jgi:hypothetical protein
MSMTNGRIAKVRKGESPTLLHESKANELIGWINALLSCPQVKVSEGKILIEAGKKVVATGPLNGVPASGVALYHTPPTPLV